MSANKSELSTVPKRPGLESSLRFFLFDNETRAFREIRHGMVCGRTGVDLTCSGDPLVSRRQCGFLIVGSDVYVEAFSTTNPTRVNSVPLPPGRKRRIRLNDVIEFGGQRLILTYQSRFPPSNVEDVPGRNGPYRAVRREDGSLTLSGQAGERTLVVVDRAQFRRLERAPFLRLRAGMMILLVVVIGTISGWLLLGAK